MKDIIRVNIRRKIKIWELFNIWGRYKYGDGFNGIKGSHSQSGYGYGVEYGYMDGNGISKVI
jgi:hypothetical protein